MLRQFVMDVEEDRRKVKTFRTGKGVGVANLAVGFDQLAAELIDLRTTKIVHGDAPKSPHNN